MSDETHSNTASNYEVGNKKPPRDKQFKKGDPRINRKGRPKTFDTFRREAVKLAGEFRKDPKTGEEVSIARMILETWAFSLDWQARRAFIEYAYGKVPTETQLTGKDGGDLELIVTTQKVSIAEAELNEWRKSMTRQLSGLNVVAMLPTSSTDTAS